MAGIVGVACGGKRTVINEMLEVIKHRGGRSEVVFVGRTSHFVPKQLDLN